MPTPLERAPHAATAPTNAAPRALREAPDADTYFADPAGRILRRRGYFCSSPDGHLLSFWGWGHADREGLEDLLELFAAVERARLAPHPQLVVLRNLESVALSAIDRFVRYHDRVTGYLRTVEREVVVRPDGVVGVLAEGFYRTVKHPAQGRVTTSLDDACAWLGGVDRAWLAACEAVEREGVLRERASLSLLAEFWPRGYLRLTLQEAARFVGLPPRTLQRRLRDAGESFVDARQRAALNRGEELLLQGASVKYVALELGFGSTAAFVAAFRRQRGETPERFRERARGR